MFSLRSFVNRGNLCSLAKLPYVPVLRMRSNECGDKCAGGKIKKSKKPSPCGTPEGQLKKKPKVNEKKITRQPSVWLNPFCDQDDSHCPYNPRFDDIYYIESDKANRKYWQTWVACPPVAIKPKKICCFKDIKAAPLRRRTSKKPKTACPQPARCDKRLNLDCPRVKRRCHRAGRIPPDCTPFKRPLDCTKPLTPYPAFSECKRIKPGALPLSECICWQKPMLCEAWAEWRRRSMRKTMR
ncbi:uncharacterized protein LOC111593369 [Drosophila hydei]|uniref:Uncharacterized protein LOC111593369 n=1 Tax=Drosophila hydei TaxID=7224 RepID=A0A6J1L9U8_DROHY|nr:uncharacterized protein LOC111593369 [Drosophila hydei]